MRIIILTGINLAVLKIQVEYALFILLRRLSMVFVLMRSGSCVRTRPGIKTMPSLLIVDKS